MGLALLAGRYRCAVVQADAGGMVGCSPRSKNLELAGLDQRLKRGVLIQ